MNALNTQNITRFSASSLPYRKITLFMALFGILARIYQYIFHKDLWLDEAMLAFSMIGIDFKDIFFAPLPFSQAAPLGFLAISKLIGSLFSYNEYGLYLFPLICGIGTIICAYKIGKILFSDFGQCVFMTLCVGSLSLLHYTTEFKQYGIEAFASFLLIYCYLKNVHFRTFSIISMILILFSNTIIFISIALIGGGDIQK